MNENMSNLLDVGEDALGRILQYSTDSTATKSLISRDTYKIGVRSWSIEQLLHRYEVIGRRYLNLASKNANTSSLGRLLKEGSDILSEIQARVLQGMISNLTEVQDKVYAITRDYSMYPLYGKLFKEYNYSAQRYRYPVAAFGAALLDVADGVYMAKETVKKFQQVYPFLGKNSLEGVAGRIASVIGIDI